VVDLFCLNVGYSTDESLDRVDHGVGTVVVKDGISLAITLLMRRVADASWARE
jgi:hypothetical protein